MSITVYNDVIVPCTVVAAGIRGKNMRSNTRVTTFNGQTQVNVNWNRTLRQYELGVIPMEIAQWAQIEAMHEVTEGGAYGMLLRDPKDDTVSATEGKLYAKIGGVNVGTVGAGYGIPTYNTMKRYQVTGTSRYKDRFITRPISAISVYKDGSPLTAGAGAGQYSVNYDTGLVTINDDASAYVSTITTGATTVITFGDSYYPALFAIGGRIWLQGVAGTAATTLNDKSHQITNISGTNVTVSTVTTGLTATGGLSKRYPQPSNSLTWSGNFYVPVHFMDDSIDWSLVVPGDYADRLVDGPTVVLQEVRE